MQRIPSRQRSIILVAVLGLAMTSPMTVHAQASQAPDGDTPVLAAGTWSIRTLLVDGRLRDLPDGSASITVFPGGAVTGWTGCSALTTVVTMEGSAASFAAPQVAPGTCDADAAARETALLSALAAVRVIGHSGPDVRLEAADGTVLASLSSTAQEARSKIEELVSDTEATLRATESTLRSANKVLAETRRTIDRTERVLSETQATLADTNAILGRVESAAQRASAAVPSAKWAVLKRMRGSESRLFRRVARSEAHLVQVVREARYAMRDRMEAIRDLIEALP